MEEDVDDDDDDGDGHEKMMMMMMMMTRVKHAQMLKMKNQEAAPKSTSFPSSGTI